MQLSWQCEEQLYRQEVDDADDIRLSVRLYSKCLDDKKRFCKEVMPGSARVKECLEENRLKEDFSPACKEEIDAVIERRVRDFKLDFRLRKDCEADIAKTCAFYGVGAPGLEIFILGRMGLKNMAALHQHALQVLFTCVVFVPCLHTLNK